MSQPKFKPGDRVKVYMHVEARCHTLGPVPLAGWTMDVAGTVVTWEEAGQLEQWRTLRPDVTLIPVLMPCGDGKRRVILVPPDHCFPAGTVNNTVL